MKTCTKCGATMTTQDKKKFVCEFCGNVVQIEQEIPIVERTLQQQPIAEREVVYAKEVIDNSEEKLGCWMWGLCLIIPIVGLIMFFIYNSKGEKKKAKSAITAAIIGFVISFIMTFSGFWDAFWEGFYGE